MTITRKHRGFLIIGIILLILILARPAMRNGAPPRRFVLITMDTTRADRLGCYGYTPAHTPALDRLAAEGILFEKAYTPVPLTLPAHASLLTGLQPPEHGLHINVSGALPLNVRTLTEILAEKGYRTAAFVASPTLAANFGLNRGFAVYDEDMSDAIRQPNLQEHRYRSGDTVVTAALAWLRQNHTPDFFCWIHLYDPHIPYHAHEKIFGDRFTESPYDAEIAFMDRQIGRVLDGLEEMGIRKNTLIIAVGDHGESLDDEHFEPRPYHGYMLYQSTLHVPLLLSLPGRYRPPRRIPDLVTLTDLFPTILRILKVQAPYAGGGRDLTPLLQGRYVEPRPSYGETEYPASFGWSPQRSLTTARWKYIRSPKEELYDLQDDRAETNNLSFEMPAKVRELDDILSDMENDMEIRQAAAVRLGTAEWRQLESLGYAGGGAGLLPSGSAPDALRDIKDGLYLLHWSESAEEFAASGRHDEALFLWKKILAADPQSLHFRNGMATAMLKSGNFREAVNQLKSLLTDIQKSQAGATPSSRRMESIIMNNLADGLAQLGKFEEALPLAREVVRMDPLNGVFHHTLASALRGTGQLGEALESARKAVSMDPENPECTLLLGQLLVENRQPEEAVTILLEQLKQGDVPEKFQAQARTLLEHVHGTE